LEIIWQYQFSIFYGMGWKGVHLDKIELECVVKGIQTINTLKLGLCLALYLHQQAFGCARDEDIPNKVSELEIVRERNLG
jgi:TM2 domain-containing membrane protein YozV